MSLKNKRILITCGPTWVPVDGVRVISNISTGELGQACALECAAKAARVTLLEGPVLNPIKDRRIRVIPFRYYKEFALLLKAQLRPGTDAVIHAAAVSDYHLKNPLKGKIASEKENLILRLSPTKKIIQGIKKAAPDTFLVGFKLDPSGNARRLREKAGELTRQARCDLVVANALNPVYRAYIIGPDNRILEQARSKAELAQKLIQQLERAL